MTKRIGVLVSILGVFAWSCFTAGPASAQMPQAGTVLNNSDDNDIWGNFSGSSDSASRVPTNRMPAAGVPGSNTPLFAAPGTSPPAYRGSAYGASSQMTPSYGSTPSYSPTPSYGPTPSYSPTPTSRPTVPYNVPGCSLSVGCGTGCCASDFDDGGFLGSACGGSRCGWLGGIIKPSDHAFDDFISPMINFSFFEDPRTLTELRPIFVNQWVPGVVGNGISAGGSVQLYAMQFRAALTDRLSLIGVKGGYIVDDTGGAFNTLLDDGWSNVTAGLKYNFIRRPETGSILSAGFTYEIPMGSRSALQDIADGGFQMFVTGGQRYLDGRAHWLTSVGYREPVNNDLQTSSIHWSNHLDFQVAERVYLFTEFAWWHWTGDASNGLPLGIAGQDLFNLSSSDVVGNNLLTQSVGFKSKLNRHSEVGIGYEFPLTGYRDIIEGRLMVDVIFRY